MPEEPTGNKRGNLLHGRGQVLGEVAFNGMKRSHGSGHLYVKLGSYYGRWRGVDGRLINKKIGEVRKRGEKNGITRAGRNAGCGDSSKPSFQRPPEAAEVPKPTVDEVSNELRERLAIEGARLSYRQNCESMQRVPILPAIGNRRIETVTRPDIERL